MADHDDAESIMGDEERSSRASARVSGATGAKGPIGKAWAWFSVQPAQTKVIVIGVIVVLGVVVWMALRKDKRVENDDEVAPGKFSPLGQNGPGGLAPGGILTYPGGSPLPPIPGQTPPSPAPPTGPTGISSGPKPPVVLPPGPTALSVTPPSSASPVTQAAAYRPPVTFPTQTTPQAASAASQVLARVSVPAGSTPARNVRPTVITRVPTERGTNVSF